MFRVANEGDAVIQIVCYKEKNIRERQSMWKKGWRCAALQASSIRNISANRSPAIKLEQLNLMQNH